MRDTTTCSILCLTTNGYAGLKPKMMREFQIIPLNNRETLFHLTYEITNYRLSISHTTSHKLTTDRKHRAQARS